MGRGVQGGGNKGRKKWDNSNSIINKICLKKENRTKLQLLLGLGWFPTPVFIGCGQGHGAPAEL